MSDNGRSAGVRRDIIVVGASAGGVEALEQLVRGLSPRLAASVLIVLHRPPDYESALPHILAGAGALPTAEARDGEPILPGRIYLAPPDRHMVIEGGLLRLLRGPKENHSRPAIDPLFRSAAQEYGPRVAGVILSGTLFDGTAGLFAVRRRGGLAIVQDPQEAAFPAMPESAIANVDIDYVLPVADIAALLSRRAGEIADTSPQAMEVGQVGEEKNDERREDAVITPMSPEGIPLTSISTEAEFDRLPEIAQRNQDEQVHGERHGRTTVLTCPDCGGTLWQAGTDPLIQFRCRVGHAYTGAGLLQGQTETLERSLWFSARMLVDKSVFLRELAENARRRGDAAALDFDSKAALAEAHSSTLRRIIEQDGAP